LVSFVSPHENMAEVDARLSKFAKSLGGIIPEYIPD